MDVSTASHVASVITQRCHVCPIVGLAYAVVLDGYAFGGSGYETTILVFVSPTFSAVSGFGSLPVRYG